MPSWLTIAFLEEPDEGTFTHHSHRMPYYSPKLTLRITPATYECRRFPPLRKSSVTLGSDASSSWVVDHPSILPAHVKFTWMPVGREFHMLVENLGAARVSVNGEPIDALFIKDGEIILVGEVEIKFTIDFIPPGDSDGSGAAIDESDQDNTIN